MKNQLTNNQTLNKNNTHKLLILSLVALSGLGLISCGPQKVQNAVATTPSNAISSIDSSGKPIAKCSHDVAGISDLSIRLETYELNGVENTNWIRVKFDRFPATFTDSSSVITFWGRTVDSSGSSYAMQSLPFYLEIKNGSTANQITSDMTELSWSSLSTLATQNSVSNSSAATALSSISFVVKLDSATASNVVTAAMYYAGSTTATRYIEALIPKFYANPTEYASNHPSNLVNLHPLKGMLGGSYSVEQYIAQSQAFCF